MALSDYLTDEEWDASYYIFLNPNKDFECNNLGEAMHHFIDKMLNINYVFEGLDSKGNKEKQLVSNNPNKFVGTFFGNLKPLEVLEILENGRKWLKEHNSDMVFESDENWKKEIEEAREMYSK